MNKNTYLRIFGATAVTASLLASVVAANASTNNPTENADKPQIGMMGRGRGVMMNRGEKKEIGEAAHAQGIRGTVASVNGNTFTVTTHVRPAPAAAAVTATPPAPVTATYTVNTTSATTYSKGKVAGTVSDVVVGANVMVKGTVDTTNLMVAADKVSVMPAMPQSALTSGIKKVMHSKR